MSDDGLGNKKRKVIGRDTSEITMHPNDLFKFLYPTLWKEYYGDRDLTEYELHAGMYAMSLGIGYKTGLYPILQDVYSPLYANAIMDYAMYFKNHMMGNDHCQFRASWVHECARKKGGRGRG